MHGSASYIFFVESGIAIFNVISGQLHKKGRLEILLDAAYWPAMSTPRARSSHMQWEYIGEGFIKELDFSRVWIRLNENDENEKEDIVCELKMEATKFLNNTLVSCGTRTKLQYLRSTIRTAPLNLHSWT